MRVTSLLLLFVSLLRFVPSAGADGMLDPSFGNGGLVTTNFGPFGQDDATSLAVLPDGRAVAVGNTSPNLAISGMAAARYLVSGALDTTFGTGGLVTGRTHGHGRRGFRAGALHRHHAGRVAVVRGALTVRS